jgi:hypothetical protein
MLEGFTKYWGFYFVAIPDSNGVGVRDFQDALINIAEYPEWAPDLELIKSEERTAQQDVNRQIATRHLRRVVAARIVVFELFLQLAIQVDGTLQEKHKRIWLLFQLSDDLVSPSRGPHPFVRIMGCLKRASEEALKELVGRLHDILGKYFTQEPPHFIFGMDEAQHASRVCPRPFLSSSNSNNFRSIIRLVVEVFTNQLRIKLIVSGTGLSLADVQESMSSGVFKSVTVRLFHELGMFDTWPKLEPFLKLYVPEPFLESKSGRHLQQRMREYLQGR